MARKQVIGFIIVVFLILWGAFMGCINKHPAFPTSPVVSDTLVARSASDTLVARSASE